MTHRNELQDEDVYINESDGLPNVHPDEVRLELANEDISPDPLDELPKSLIVTNVRPDVFENPDLRAEMERLFAQFSSSVSFVWLRSFRRLRVNYADAGAAAAARVSLHRLPFPPSSEHAEPGRIGCYFTQPSRSGQAVPHISTVVAARRLGTETRTRTARQSRPPGCARSTRSRRHARDRSPDRFPTRDRPTRGRKRRRPLDRAECTIWRRRHDTIFYVTVLQTTPSCI
jgi:hypothetical protein